MGQHTVTCSACLRCLTSLDGDESMEDTLTANLLE